MLRFERAHIGHATGTQGSPLRFSDARLSVLQHALVRTGKLVVAVSRRGVCSKLGSGQRGATLAGLLGKLLRLHEISVLLHFGLDPVSVRAEAEPSAPHGGA